MSQIVASRKKSILVSARTSVICGCSHKGGGGYRGNQLLVTAAGLAGQSGTDSSSCVSVRCFSVEKMGRLAVEMILVQAPGRIISTYCLSTCA